MITVCFAQPNYQVSNDLLLSAKTHGTATLPLLASLEGDKGFQIVILTIGRLWTVVYSIFIQRFLEEAVACDKWFKGICLSLSSGLLACLSRLDLWVTLKFNSYSVCLNTETLTWEKARTKWKVLLNSMRKKSQFSNTFWAFLLCPILRPYRVRHIKQKQYPK